MFKHRLTGDRLGTATVDAAEPKTGSQFQNENRENGKMKNFLTDCPPEQEPQDSKVKTMADMTMEEATRYPDIGAQPDPEAPDFRQHLTTRRKDNSAARSFGNSDVTWPSDDREAPDYAYLVDTPEASNFQLTPDVLETLFTAGHYQPYRTNGVIAFALRGAELVSGDQAENVSSVQLRTTRPDHRNFRCVIGFYFTATNRLNVYTGSTVPCRKAIAGYANGGSACNMLPTGMHTFFIWRHRNIQPALRMGLSSADPESGADATVLRSTNDAQMETLDIFDMSQPYDNVHCSYYLSENADLGARFSSWGCLTVRGQSTPSDQWARFQRVLTSIGSRQRVDLLLATGKEASLATNGQTAALVALRFGSRGQEVSRLQNHLGLTETGYLGAKTLDLMTGAERAHNQASGNGRRATGIYTPVLDHSTNWGVFT